LLQNALQIGYKEVDATVDTAVNRIQFGITRTQVKEEVARSREQLERLIGDEVVSFAYPYGIYGSREVAAVRSAGYQFAVGTENGPLYPAEDRWRIRRIAIFSGSGGSELNGGFP
jgi:peptidoglycan/xylan/chitin deacetylase (PgdA/CDA1 family)